MPSPKNPTQKDIKQAVIETLGYYSLQKSALKIDELWRRLHDLKITQSDLKNFLDKRHKNIVSQEGFFTLKGQEQLISLRRQNLEDTACKWRLIEEHIDLLRNIPFMRGICISGSISAGNANSKADIDLFVVTRKNRIWLCRLFLALSMRSAGIYRQERANLTTNLFCPNHFISENALELEPKNIYTAHLYSQFAPLIGPEVTEKLRITNLRWIRKFLPNSYGRAKSPLPVYSRRFSFYEILFFGPFGWLAEKLAALTQKIKIKRNPNFGRDFSAGGIKMSKTELTFHGKPQEPRMLTNFENLKTKLLEK